MHSEFYRIEEEDAELINETKKNGEELFLLEQQVQELWNLLQKKMELCMQRADGQTSSFIQDINLK